MKEQFSSRRQEAAAPSNYLADFKTLPLSNLLDRLGKGEVQMASCGNRDNG